VILGKKIWFVGKGGKNVGEWSAYFERLCYQMPDQDQMSRVRFLFYLCTLIINEKMHIKNTILFVMLGCFFLGGISTTANAQEKGAKKRISRALYFSWGYNEEWYTNSTIHVTQKEQGNSYDLVHVQGHDHKGWDEGLLSKALTIPQYNYRLGCYFNEKQDLAIELNFDHTKYIVQEGQTVRVKGTMKNAPVDSNVVFAANKGFHYFLNNGANFFLFNIVKRVGLYESKTNNLRVDFLGKAGVGPVIPHVDNSFYGQENKPAFQIGGWNTGLETALRFTIMRYAYLELAQKVDYARYSNLSVYGGIAKQNFGTYELILSVGATIPTRKNNPLFRKEHVTASTARQTN
jgi:hypothetical protein